MLVRMQLHLHYVDASCALVCVLQSALLHDVSCVLWFSAILQSGMPYHPQDASNACLPASELCVQLSFWTLFHTSVTRDHRTLATIFDEEFWCLDPSALHNSLGIVLYLAAGLDRKGLVSLHGISYLSSATPCQYSSAPAHAIHWNSHTTFLIHTCSLEPCTTSIHVSFVSCRYTIGLAHHTISATPA